MFSFWLCPSDHVEERGRRGLLLPLLCLCAPFALSGPNISLRAAAIVALGRGFCRQAAGPDVLYDLWSTDILDIYVDNQSTTRYSHTHPRARVVVAAGGHQ